MPSALPPTSPAARSDWTSTTLPAGTRPRSVTVTSSYSSRNGLWKPNFGRRRCSGIWPPSKPSKCMLPVRAFWPLPPRPAVLPRPEAWPRPTRLRTLVAPRGAFSWFSDDMSVPFYPMGAGRARRGRSLGLAGLAAHRRGGVHTLPGHEVPDLADHPHGGRGVGEDLGGIGLLETHSGHDHPVRGRNPGQSVLQRHLDGCHRRPLPYSCISAVVLPRIWATRSALRSRFSPATVALSTLCGLREPWLLVSTLRTPAASSTARTAPPAMTPVPSLAGLSSTFPAPKWPSTSCGMVVPASGTRKMFFFACSPPLRMASGTSLAFPRPTPTCPWPSPTTISAEKLKRRPPLTTLATRLMWTTRSVRSRSFTLMGAAIRPSVLR